MIKKKFLIKIDNIQKIKYNSQIKNSNKYKSKN